MTLTTEMEKALVKGVRKQLAKRLRKERALFKSGLKVLQQKNGCYWFIEDLKITKSITLDDTESFTTLIDIVNDTKREMTKYCYDFKVNFFSDWEGEGYDIDYTDPYADVTYKTYKMKTAKMCKSFCNTHIKMVVRDAKFKLVHQPNGKDTKRFLKIIEIVRKEG